MPEFYLHSNFICLTFADMKKHIRAILHNVVITSMYSWIITHVMKNSLGTTKGAHQPVRLNSDGDGVCSMTKTLGVCNNTKNLESWKVDSQPIYITPRSWTWVRIGSELVEIYH